MSGFFVIRNVRSRHPRYIFSLYNGGCPTLCASLIPTGQEIGVNPLSSLHNKSNQMVRKCINCAYQLFGNPHIPLLPYVCGLIMACLAAFPTSLLACASYVEHMLTNLSQHPFDIYLIFMVDSWLPISPHGDCFLRRQLFIANRNFIYIFAK